MSEDHAGGDVPERWNALGAGSNMWMDPAKDPRFAAGAELEGERATLLDYLRAYRLAIEMKCADLDASQLARRSVPPSTMSLLGLVRHLADVERNWFRRVMAQVDAPPLYWSQEVEDADWLGAAADPAVVADAWRAWREEGWFDARPGSILNIGSPHRSDRDGPRGGAGQRWGSPLPMTSSGSGPPLVVRAVRELQDARVQAGHQR
jgi:hypothetical protein